MRLRETPPDLEPSEEYLEIVRAVLKLDGVIVAGGFTVEGLTPGEDGEDLISLKYDTRDHGVLWIDVSIEQPGSGEL